MQLQLVWEFVRVYVDCLWGKSFCWVAVLVAVVVLVSRSFFLLLSLCVVSRYVATVPRGFGVSLGVVLGCFELSVSSVSLLFCSGSERVLSGVSESRRRFGGGGGAGGISRRSDPNGVSFPTVRGAGDGVFGRGSKCPLDSRLDDEAIGRSGECGVASCVR